MTTKVLEIDKTKTAVSTEMAHDEMQQYSAVAKALGITHPKARLEELKAFLSENGITVYPVEKVDAYLRYKAAKEGNAQTYWCWKPVRTRDRRKNASEPAMAVEMTIEVPPDIRAHMEHLKYEAALRGGSSIRRVEEEIRELEHRYGRPVPVRSVAPWMVDERMLGQPLRKQSKHGSFVSTVYPHAIPLAVLLTMQKIQEQFPEAQFQASDYAVERPDPFLAVMLPETEDLFIIERWDEPGFRM